MQVQSIVGGRYRLGGSLGHGGMAEVRIGLDTRLGRTVAVKLLTPELATDEVARALFQSEARAAASLNHPGIVRVYDAGEDRDPLTGATSPYIVMELVGGQTLSSLLRRAQKLPPQRALRLTRSVLNVLAYSHEAGIVHQDIKPSNLMLTPSGEVKLMDFGIARGLAESSPGLPLTAGFVGTANYLSPEQARGETTDVRSDIYSTGCLMYALLVRRPPFTGDSFGDIVQQQLHNAPVRPSALDDGIGVEIDEIVLRSLAKDPKDRYQAAPAMSADIDHVLGTRQATAGAPTPASMRISSAPRPSGRPSSARSVERRVDGQGGSASPRRKLFLVAAGLVGLLGPMGGLALNNAGGPTVDQAQGKALPQALPVAETHHRSVPPPPQGPSEPGSEAVPPAQDTAGAAGRTVAGVPAARTSAGTGAVSRRSIGPKPRASSAPPRTDPDSTERVTSGPTSRPEGSPAPPAEPRRATRSGRSPNRSESVPQRAQPSEQEGSDQPTKSPKPDAPGQREEPAKPSKRQPSSEPTRPSQPDEPQEPKPSRPAEPQEPKASKSTDPQQPPKSSKPSKPAEPQPPSKPSKPQPDKPDQPAKPSRPSQPAKPGPPSKPAKPAKPAKPDKPSNPDKPQQPGKPGKPSKPDKPEQPGASGAPLTGS